MTVPGRIEAASLLRSLDPPAWLERHSRAVAEVAAFLAARAAERGSRVDRGLVEAAALLHDVDKALPPDDPRRALPHGRGSARWLADAGHSELSPAVADHPVPRLLDGRWFEAWLDASSLEDRIVAYADKRAGRRLESLEGRFAGWQRRYPAVRGEGEDAWTVDQVRAVRERAGSLERVVCEAAGTTPGQVRRLRWTASAFRAISDVPA